MLAAFIVLACLTVGVLFFRWWFITAKKFDDVVRAIYVANHEQWRVLGEPIGFFWRPGESVRFFASTKARNRLFFVFLFRQEILRVDSSENHHE